jgi:hypothetical protein
MRHLAVLLISMLVMISLTACTGVGPASSEKSAGEAATSTPGAATSAVPTPVPSATPAPSATPLQTDNKPAATPVASSSEDEAKNVIEKRIKETITAIEQKDMKQLSGLVHPVKGVQFSPYAYVDTAKDVRVQAGNLTALWKDTKKISWGEYDGSGDPIELTFADYFQKFVYDHDYAKAPKTGYNKIIGKSTTSNNLFTVYPKDKFFTVEYHFDGFDKKFEGHDWSSLRLVFEGSGADWFLVAVVHDQWTT